MLAVIAGCHPGSQGGRADAPPAGDATAPDAPRPLPVVQQSTELCKLLNNLNVSDPTPNDVQFRSNVLGADLGISIENADQLYVFFGDTIGFAGIWGDGQSHPDAVGYAMDPADMVAAHPELLCDRLGIVSLPPASSIGPTIDARVQADFAAGSMVAPAGHALGEYIHNPAGSGSSRFTNLPGDFEVPSGGFSYAGSIYLFYTTVVSTSDVTMAGSYLARWDAPSASAIPSYQILYAVDERLDDHGPLYGDFINISAAAAGDYIYLFGTGAYRASPIHLARKPLASLATPGGFELFDAATGTWSAARGAPIITAAGYGETSTRYFANLDRWMFLAEEEVGGANRIVARFADAPQGPWSDAIAIHDMADAAFRAIYCCAPDNNCAGAEMMNCDRTGFYGTYLLPAATDVAGGFAVTYTMSSFDPYNVALFQTSFAGP